jgi:hydroxyacylglutathione hydrolase
MKISFQNDRLTVFESELMQTTCSLIQGDDYVLLVDPNWLPSEVEYIAAFVQDIQQGRKLYLFFTHSDYDHIIAYEKFRLGAEIIVSQALLDNPQKEDQLEEIRKFYDQYYLKPPWPITYPDTADIVVKGEQEVHQLGQTAYYFFQAPGHNADGLIAWCPDTGILLSGDYLCDVEFPFIYHSIAEYQTTLFTLKQIINTGSVRFLVPGHGNIASSQDEIQNRLAAANWYLQHLTDSVINDRLFPEAELWARYPHFPVIQQKYHQDNLALAQKEIG